MQSIRNMLKDGMFEYAIRYFYLNLASNFIEEQRNLYYSWMEELALKYGEVFGTNQAVIDALKSAPQGSI